MIRGQYFYLYLFMDVFSRKIVGWQVYAEESSAQASEVLKDLCARVKRNLKLIQLRTQTQSKFDTPAHTVIS